MQEFFSKFFLTKIKQNAEQYEEQIPLKTASMLREPLRRLYAAEEFFKSAEFAINSLL